VGDRAVIAVFVLSFAFFSGEPNNEQQVWVTVLSLQYSSLLFAFFSGESTNEQQLWVTVLSLQYSSLL